MKTKEFNTDIKQAGEDVPGIIAYASTFDRVPDSYGDIVAPGAFAESLKAWEESGRSIPLLFGHRTDDPFMNIGKVTDAREDEKGLLITAEFDMENPNAVKARRDVIAGTLGKMSFAYEVLDEEFVTLEDGTKANELRKLNLFEVSLVPIPANQFAVVTDVKAAEIEEKAGRRNSAADAGELEKISDHAEQIMEIVSGLTADNMDEADAEPKEQPEAKQACEEQTEAKENAEAEANEKENLTEKEKQMDNAIIENIAKPEAVEVEAAPKNLGEMAVKAAATVRSNERFTVSTGAKAATDPHTVGHVGTTTAYDRGGVYGARKPLNVYGLFGHETISGNTLSYYVEGNAAGAFATVAEAGQKPQVNIPGEVKTVNLDKIAAFLKESDEMLNDAAWLASAINERGVYLAEVYEESYLVGKLAATSGIQSINTGISFDTILKAKTDVQAVSGFAADAVLMNPTDYATLAASKASTSGVYLLGGPGAANADTIWGLPVVLSSEVTSGTAYVGAFKLGGSVVENKEGMRVEMTNSNEDDFEKNLVTVRIEKREGLAVRYPMAFVKVYSA